MEPLSPASGLLLLHRVKKVASEQFSFARIHQRKPSPVPRTHSGKRLNENANAMETSFSQEKLNQSEKWDLVLHGQGPISAFPAATHLLAPVMSVLLCEAPPAAHLLAGEVHLPGRRFRGRGL